MSAESVLERNVVKNDICHYHQRRTKRNEILHTIVISGRNYRGLVIKCISWCEPRTQEIVTEGRISDRNRDLFF
jgi:hypothetical protein